MGFYPINKAKIERIYETPRVLIVSVYDDVSGKWEEEKFPADAMYAALKWIEQKMLQLEM